MHALRQGFLRAAHGHQVRFASARTASALLQKGPVASALSAHGLSADDAVEDKAARVALLAAFVETCEMPVPSNALADMKSAASMAAFFEQALAPADVQPHAQRMFQGRVDLEGIAPLDPLETTTENLRDRFATDLPPNLKIDVRTFEDRPQPVMQTTRRPAGLPFITTKMIDEKNQPKKKIKR